MQNPRQSQPGQSQQADETHPPSQQPGGDVVNPRPAPGTSRDPLVHPGDQPDILPDVLADERQPPGSKKGSPAVGGQGNAKPTP